jgi:hypothetical protein
MLSTVLRDDGVPPEDRSACAVVDVKIANSLALPEYLVVAAARERNQQAEGQPEVRPVEQAPPAAIVCGDLNQRSRIGVEAKAQRTVLQNDAFDSGRHLQLARDRACGQPLDELTLHQDVHDDHRHGCHRQCGE